MGFILSFKHTVLGKISTIKKKEREKRKTEESIQADIMKDKKGKKNNPYLRRSF